MKIIKATMADIKAVTHLAWLLWPEHVEAELQKDMEPYITSDETAAFLAEENGEKAGLCLCSLRHDYVEGTETSPVGYLEGIYVQASFRKKGIALALLKAAESWAKEMGCTEFASDCELDNTESLAFHLACGFREENRIICFVTEL